MNGNENTNRLLEAILISLQDIEKNIRVLKDDVRVLKEEMSEVKQELKALNQRVDKIDRRLGNFEVIILSHNEKISSLVKIYDEDVRDLKARMTRVESRIN
jgi:chromosome segregation ATPase